MWIQYRRRLEICPQEYTNDFEIDILTMENEVKKYVSVWNELQQKMYVDLLVKLKHDEEVDTWDLPKSFIEIDKKWCLQEEDFEKLQDMDFEISGEECEYYQVDDYMNDEYNNGEVEEELVSGLFEIMIYSNDYKSKSLTDSFHNRRMYMDKKEVREHLEEDSK